jgi:predicted  nucleic acid-binding Zn-ribbon protein
MPRARSSSRRAHRDSNHSGRHSDPNRHRGSINSSTKHNDTPDDKQMARFLLEQRDHAKERERTASAYCERVRKRERQATTEYEHERKKRKQLEDELAHLRTKIKGG